MNKAAFISAIFTASALTSVSASANDGHHDDKDGVYVTIGGTSLSTELDLDGLDIGGETVDLGTEDATVTMINGRIGYRFNDYFAVEGEAGFGLGNDDFDRVIPVEVAPLGTVNVDANVELGVENYYVAFARGILPVSDQFDVFARVGFGQATAEADITASALGFAASGSESESRSGFAYGVGGQFNLTDHDGIRADYTRLDETDIISLAYARRF